MKEVLYHQKSLRRRLLNLQSETQKGKSKYLFQHGDCHAFFIFFFRLNFVEFLFSVKYGEKITKIFIVAYPKTGIPVAIR